MAGDANAACVVAAISGMINDDDTMYKYAKLSVELSGGHNDGALDILGSCYKGGFGCEKDEKRAFELLLEASELGNDEAQWKLGVYYMSYGVVEKDLDEAIFWLSKSAEADNDMGRHYLEGAKLARDLGVDVDILPHESDA